MKLTANLLGKSNLQPKDSGVEFLYGGKTKSGQHIGGLFMAVESDIGMVLGGNLWETIQVPNDGLYGIGPGGAVRKIEQS